MTGTIINKEYKKKLEALEKKVKDKILKSFKNQDPKKILLFINGLHQYINKNIGTQNAQHHFSVSENIIFQFFSLYDNLSNTKHSFSNSVEAYRMGAEKTVNNYKRDMAKKVSQEENYDDFLCKIDDSFREYLIKTHSFLNSYSTVRNPYYDYEFTFREVYQFGFDVIGLSEEEIQSMEKDEIILMLELNGRIDEAERLREFEEDFDYIGYYENLLKKI